MEDVDWPSEIIKDDFLLSGIQTTSSDFSVAEPLGIITSTATITSACAETQIIGSNSNYKLSTINDSLIRGI